MLNPERIILMTKMASYEENEGKQNVSIGNYFRGDYISMQVIKSMFCAIIAFGLMFALYIFYDLETFLQDIYKMDLIEFAKNVLTLLGISVVAYTATCYLAYSFRYAKAKKSLRNYYNNLKKLNTFYKT